jgi:hypothetical protein
MAVNKSKNPNQQNTAASVGEDYTPLGILNAIQKAESLQYHQGYRQLSEQMEALQTDPIYMAGKRYPGQFAGTNLEKDFNEQVANLNRKIRKQEILEQGSQTRAQSTIASQINKSFSESSMNGQALKFSSDSNIQLDILRQAGTVTPADISRRMRASDERLRSYEKEAHEINTNKLVDRYSDVDPAAKNRLSEIFKLRETEIKERALLHGVSRAHSALGIDDKSVTISRLKTEAETARTIGTGGIGLNEAKAFQDALKELTKEVERTEDELKTLNDAVDKTQKAYDDASGGGVLSKGAKFNYYAGGLSAAGAMAQTMLVSQRVQEVNNISGYASLANNQYDIYKAARGGDIASQLALGELRAASDFGTEMKQGTLIAQGVQAGGTAFDAAAGFTMMTEAGAQKANAISYGLGISTQNTTAALAGAGQFVSATASGLALGTDMFGTNGNGPITATTNQIGGFQAHMQAVQAINEVGAKQAQGLRDFYTGLDVVSQNMGTGSEAFLNGITGATSQANLEAMQRARMSPEQFAKAADMGINQMGSTFDTNQIYGARNLEVKGFGSVERNLQRIGTLASAGANNPQASMEVVLSAAVAAGLDKSKGLDSLVQNTAAMAASSLGAAIGFDTAGASTAMIMASMDPNMKNRENALNQAMTAQDILRQSTTNKDVSFIGMANTGILADKLGAAGIDIAGKSGSLAVAISNLQGMSVQDLKTLQTQDPKEAAKTFQDQGVNVDASNVKSLIDITLKEKTSQATRRASAALNISNDEIQRILAIPENKRTQDERVILGQIMKVEGYAGGDTGARAVSGINAPNTLPTKGKELTSDKDTGDLKSQLDKLRTSGFQQLTEAAMTASTQLGGFNKALKTFSDLQMKYEKDGMNNEKAFTTAASTMAKDFSTVAKDFKGATTEYEKASKEMIKAANLINYKLSLPSWFQSPLNEKK